MSKYLKYLKEAKAKAKENKLKAPERKKLGNITYDVSKIKWEHPLDAFDKIQEEFMKLGFIIVQEDDTKWAGVWSKGKPGKENHERFNFARLVSDDPNELQDTITNSVLVFNWYVADEKVKTEINAYVS